MTTDGVSDVYVESLRQFLVDASQAAALEGALVEAEWDSDLDEGLRDALARIRLVLSEVAQEIRPAEELQVEIVRLLASLAADSLESCPSTEVFVDLVGEFSISRVVFSLDSSESQRLEMLSAETPASEAPATVALPTEPVQASSSLEEVQVISEPVAA